MFACLSHIRASSHELSQAVADGVDAMPGCKLTDYGESSRRNRSDSADDTLYMYYCENVKVRVRISPLEKLTARHLT